MFVSCFAYEKNTHYSFPWLSIQILWIARRIYADFVAMESEVFETTGWTLKISPNGRGETSTNNQFFNFMSVSGDVTTVPIKNPGYQLASVQTPNQLLIS